MCLQYKRLAKQKNRIGGPYVKVPPYNGAPKLPRDISKPLAYFSATSVGNLILRPPCTSSYHQNLLTLTEDFLSLPWPRRDGNCRKLLTCTIVRSFGPVCVLGSRALLFDFHAWRNESLAYGRVTLTIEIAHWEIPHALDSHSFATYTKLASDIYLRRLVCRNCFKAHLLNVKNTLNAWIGITIQ